MGAFPGAWTYAGRPSPPTPLVSGSLLPSGCVGVYVCVCVCFISHFTKHREHDTHKQSIGKSDPSALQQILLHSGGHGSTLLPFNHFTFNHFLLVQ